MRQQTEDIDSVFSLMLLEPERHEGLRDSAWDATTYRAEPDTGQVVPSYFLGEVGILLVLWLLTVSGLAADRLYESVKPKGMGYAMAPSLEGSVTEKVCPPHMRRASVEKPFLFRLSLFG